MKTNIIIVDDLEINRLLLNEFLKKIPNINITEACNGQECINIINDNTKIILMDIMMPVLNGIDATKIIKIKYPHIIIIGVTGQLQSDGHKIFDAMLYKPYFPDNLFNLINSYL